MRRALAGAIVIVFAGLICTSLLTLFMGSSVATQTKNLQYPYYMSF